MGNDCARPGKTLTITPRKARYNERGFERLSSI